MSTRATTRLLLIKALYVEAGSPDPKLWYFEAGTTSEDLDELARLGLVFKIFGTPRGFAWRLSDEGVRQLHALF